MLVGIIEVEVVAVIRIGAAAVIKTVGLIVGAVT
jgi:hypothetical protein